MTNGDMIRKYLFEMDDDELCRAATDLIQGNITNAEWEKLKDTAGENIYSRMMLWLSQQSKEEEDPDSVDMMPEIEAEHVRHGRWIFVGEETMHDGWTYRKYKCSECDFVTVEAKNFCQNCGAKMDADHIADVSKKVGGTENDDSV